MCFLVFLVTAAELLWRSLPLSPPPLPCWLLCKVSSWVTLENVLSSSRQELCRRKASHLSPPLGLFEPCGFHGFSLQTHVKPDLSLQILGHSFFFPRTKFEKDKFCSVFPDLSHSGYSLQANSWGLILPSSLAHLCGSFYTWY